jgi:hypothetical protein
MKLVKRFSLLLILCLCLGFVLTSQRTALADDPFDLEDDFGGCLTVHACDWCKCMRTKCQNSCTSNCSNCDTNYDYCASANSCPP